MKDKLTKFWILYSTQSLRDIFFQLFIKDYKYRLASAKSLNRTILGSTYGRTNHFYNADGVKIRGWAEKQYRFKNELSELELKYK